MSSREEPGAAPTRRAAGRPRAVDAQPCSRRRTAAAAARRSRRRWRGSRLRRGRGGAVSVAAPRAGGGRGASLGDRRRCKAAPGPPGGARRGGANRCARRTSASSFVRGNHRPGTKSMSVSFVAQPRYSSRPSGRQGYRCATRAACRGGRARGEARDLAAGSAQSAVDGGRGLRPCHQAVTMRSPSCDCRKLKPAVPAEQAREVAAATRCRARTSLRRVRTDTSGGRAGARPGTCCVGRRQISTPTGPRPWSTLNVLRTARVRRRPRPPRDGCSGCDHLVPRRIEATRARGTNALPLPGAGHQVSKLPFGLHPSSWQPFASNSTN